MDDQNPYRSPNPPLDDNEPGHRELEAAAAKEPFTGRLATIARFLEPIEADLARGRLQADGIRVFIEGSGFASMNWPLSMGNRGVKLQVPTEDAERATAILNELSQANDEDAGEDEWSETDDDEADAYGKQEPDDEPELTVREQIADRAFRGAVLGVLFLPIQFYVFWLLLRVFVSDEPLSSRLRGRALIAAAINLPLIVLISFWLKGFFPRH